MPKQWLVVALLGAAAASAQAADGEIASRVAVGRFEATSLGAKQAKAIRHAVLSGLRDLQAEIIVEDMLLTEDCLASPSCLRKAAAPLDLHGVLEVRAVRFGPKLRVTLRSYDAATGDRILESVTKGRARRFKAKKMLTRDLERALDAIRERHPIAAPPPPPPTEAVTSVLVATPEVPETPTARPPTPPPVASTESVGDDRDRTLEFALGWAAAGIGSSLLIGGAVTGVMALMLNGELAEACPGGTCAADHGDDVQTLGTLATATNVLLASGATTAVVGGVVLGLLFASSDEGNEDLRVSTAPPSQEAVHALP